MNWQPIFNLGVGFNENLPEDTPIWLYEKGRGIWIGTFSNDDGWVFTNCYGNQYMNSDGKWDTDTADFDDDYAPTHWMPLPKAPE